ncbi:MAG: deacylase, partial [Desulfovibrio sp.]|nr:deacylase [Desulfovibrio sp.]
MRKDTTFTARGHAPGQSFAASGPRGGSRGSRVVSALLRGLALLVFSAVLLVPCRQPQAETFPLDFTTIRLGAAPRAVLVVGGIQGDEPGGFSAATLLATRYEIAEGAVWVVPNLNFPSIIKRSRGLYGDMNRKFARLAESDPEFATVRRIQELIRHPQVGLVLNLHDGSGYYRPRHEDRLRNPARWGQSVIIDQDELDPGTFMGALAAEADAVAREANSRLIRPLHALHVHNTHTAAGDREMEKSLSYFAVRHGKAAFGLEASKEFPVELRAYYHLLMVEAFLRRAGVRFSRDFELTPAGVARALRDNLGVSFAENRVFLPLDDVRPAISYLPLPRNSPARAITSKPIMAVLPCEGKSDRICIHYGNRTITLIR